MSARFLGFDLGAESGRAILGTLAGERLSIEELHRFSNDPVALPTGLYWDTLRLFHEIRRGIDIAVRERHVELDGIGIDTWGVDFGLLGKDGALVDNPRHYRDPRNSGQLERTFSVVSKEEVFAATGIQFMQINSLYQWHAMEQAHAPALSIATCLLFMPDLFNYFLTGVQRAEVTIASTSQFYNPIARTWAYGLLEKLGLRATILPVLIEPGMRLGPALDTKVPVYATAGHDTAAAVVAVPANTAEPDWCYISSGTWSLMGVETPLPVITEDSLRLNFTNEIGAGGRVRLLKNIAGLWLWQECRRHWASQGTTYTYEEMARMAREAKPFSTTVHPDGFLETGHMPDRIADWCREHQQPVAETHADLCRAILEGLALRYRQVLESLEQLVGHRISRIHIVGGGSRNGLLNQFVADATGRRVIAGPSEATAAGNILVQAMGAGAVQSIEQARTIIGASFPVEEFLPGPDRKGWNAAYERFQRLTP
jgi:rhamnulokinase